MRDSHREFNRIIYFINRSNTIKVRDILKLLIKYLIAFRYYFYNNFISHVPVYSIRHLYLRAILHIQIGKNSCVHMGCFITGRNIRIGNNSVINRNCFLDGRIGIDIGNNVSISPHTFLVSLGHDAQSPQFTTKGGPVAIADYVWIGIRATILPNVNLGKGCVVGAGSTVTKSFEDFSIVAGNPAKIIGKRTTDLQYEPTYFPLFNSDILSKDS